MLEAFLADPTLSLSGAEVHQQSGIASGTLYPILLRLESAGWFVSRWESVDPSSRGPAAAATLSADVNGTPARECSFRDFQSRDPHMNEREANGEPTGIGAGGFVSRWDRVSQWLVHRAATAAPAALMARLQEEWLADLSTRPSIFSRLRFALGCCWATIVIAHEVRAAVPVTSTAAGPRPLIVNLLGDAGYFSRRSLTLLLVVALHVALFFALMNGLVTKVHRIIEQPIVPRIIDRTHPRELPRPPPPALEKWRMIDIPPPENPRVEVYEDTVDIDPDVHKTSPQPLIPPSPARAVNRVQGGPGSGFPNTDEFYPSLSKWKLEQGIATVRVCVDASGRLTADPTTVESSGSARLDAGALQLAKAGSGHYRPTLEDGKAVNSCYSFRVRFELRN